MLAGGKSSRMGRDKALLELAGKPLVLHAVTKLRRVCSEVQILSSKAELERFAPLVRDMREGCGPLGGMEAGLGHSWHEWNLFMPVDMPFLPSAFLDNWVRRSSPGRKGVRVWRCLRWTEFRSRCSACCIEMLFCLCMRRCEREELRYFRCWSPREKSWRQGRVCSLAWHF